MKTKTFIFVQKNGPGTFTTSALNYDEAYDNLCDEVIDTKGWRCEDEDGEDE